MTQIKYELPVIQVQEIAQIYRKNINSPELRKIIIGYIKLKTGKLSLLSEKFLKAKKIEMGEF